MSRDVLNDEDLQSFQPIKLKGCEVDFEGRKDAVAKRKDAVSKKKEAGAIPGFSL